MDKTNECNCPFCGQEYILENGITPEEHLARGILRTYNGMQKSTQIDDLPCPRCGHMRMRPELAANAVSRHFDVHICSECGTDEAMRDYSKDIRPLFAWFIVKELLKRMPGIHCPKHIPDQNSEYPLCVNRKCEISTVCNLSAYMADQGGYDRYDE